MSRAKQLAVSAVLVSLALGLSYTERLIPMQMAVPLPGIKLGLANIVTVTALYLLGARSALYILLLRCILGAMFGGGLYGLFFSLSGGILAWVVMAAARHCPLFSVYGVSILGAAAHSVGQILTAMGMLRSVYAAAYLPYLLIVSLFTGPTVGMLSAAVLRVPLHKITLNQIGGR